MRGVEFVQATAGMIAKEIDKEIVPTTNKG